MAERDEPKQVIRDMTQQVVIEPSNSLGASPVVLKKKDAATRFCVDYLRLNDVTKKDSYLLSRIDDLLTGSTIFFTLDLKCGYWQVEIIPEERYNFLRENI